MDIQNITQNITNSISFGGLKTNRYLLNEKIEDKATFSRPTTKEVVHFAQNLKTEEGKSRFNEAELEELQESYKNGKMDFEPIQKLAKNTEIPLKGLQKINELNKKSEKKNIYTTLDKKITEIKADNKKLVDFEISKFLPENEFLLKIKDKKTGEVATYSYNLDGDATSVTHCTNEKTKDGKTKITLVTENFKDNSLHEKVTIDDNFISSTITKRDKNNNVTRVEKMTPSDVAGVLNVKYEYPDGKVEDVAKGSINPKTGITTVKKDMKSPDGTRTEFLYEDDPQGNRLIDYKITDKNGKLLMKQSQTFEVVSDNKFISSVDSDKYEITVDKAKLHVKDLGRGLEADINFQKQCKGKREEVISLLKKVSGDELFDVVDSVKKIKGHKKEDTLDANFASNVKQLNISDNLYSFLHELGHAKDSIGGQNISEYEVLTSNEAYYKKNVFTNNKEIQKNYNEEVENFYNNSTNQERDMISYFLPTTTHYHGKLGGLNELIAETNALTNSIPTKEIEVLAPRVQVAQQHFPKTIAAIKDAMNYKNEQFAIEFYGT